MHKEAMKNLTLAQMSMIGFWLWAIACLIAPRLLFFAHPDKKKRLHGVLFPFFTSIFVVGVGNTFTMPSQLDIQNFVICIVFVAVWARYAFFLRISAVQKPQEKHKAGFMERWRDSVEKAKESEVQRKAAVALEKKRQKQVTAYSQTSDREYTLLPYFAECTCPDWHSKRRDAHGPFALCKHLVSHYVTYPDDTPEDIQPFRGMLLSFAIAEKGIPPMGKIGDYGEIEGRGYLFTGYADSLPWVNVYTDVTGDERYGYNIQEERWAKNEQPPHAKELEALIEAAT